MLSTPKCDRLSQSLIRLNSMLRIIKSNGWNTLPFLLDDLCEDQADAISEGNAHQFWITPSFVQDPMSIDVEGPAENLGGGGVDRAICETR